LHAESSRQREGKSACVEAGAAAYLRKDAKREAIIATIEQLMSGRAD
jgi:hypothetical protein